MIRKNLAVMFCCLAAACGPDSTGGPAPTVAADMGPADSGEQTDVRSASSIDVAAETWTWIEFPESACGNGQPAGIGINITDRSDDVFVYFQGGGACWDVNSCFVVKSAINIESGYDEAQFEVDPIPNAPAFDRSLDANPFRDMSYVYVPYCTGDMHAGDQVRTYSAVGQTRDVHHRGGHNVERFLSRLKPTFSDAGRVFVAGSSAGGYGAQLNMHRFVESFPDAEVHVLSDSGPLVQPWGTRFGEFNNAWTFQLPSGCDDCGDGFPQWFDHLAATYPDSRIGLSTFDADQTIHLYFAYPIGDAFKNALVAFVADHYVTPTTQVYMLPGTQHVMLGNLMTLDPPNAPALIDWTRAWIDGSDWRSTTP